MSEVEVVAPTVTVAIPTYNGAATLGAAIESVLAQSLRDFELLVVDDRSTDGTPALVARFQDPRIRFLSNSSNLGPQGNWNRCLEAARGRYFKLLPHDDLLHPDCLRAQVVVLEQDKQHALALVFCAREVLGPEGKRLTRRGYPASSSGRLAAEKVRRRCVRLGTNLLGEPGALLFRRDLALRIGPFDAQQPYVIDLDYWFRLLAHGDAYYLIEPLASFRVSGGQWSVQVGRCQAAEFRRFIQRQEAFEPLGLSVADIVIGSLTPTLNNIARRVFYTFFL